MIDLRSAATLDEAALAALFNAAYRGYWFPVELDAGSFARMVEVADVDLAASCVAVEDAEPVGIALVAGRGRAGWIGGMGVVATHRRRGVGAATLLAALDAARQIGIEEVTLEVLEQNVGARTLYERLGFAVVRELEVWSVPGAPGETAVPEVAPERAHAWIREHRSAREPWQRADGSLAHMDDARGLELGGRVDARQHEMSLTL